MAAGTAAAAAVGASLASGSLNLSSMWTILNTFQLLVVIGMLDGELPTKLEAFIQGFDIASLNVPDEYNIALILFPEANNTGDQVSPYDEIVETNERFASFGFTSPVFLI